MINLATEYLQRNGQTVHDWDGLCGELANEVMGPNDDMLYVEGCRQWRFHMAPLIAGLVHDAWCEGPALPPKEWLKAMFQDRCVTLSLNGVDIYEGPANRFDGVTGMPVKRTTLPQETFLS